MVINRVMRESFACVLSRGSLCEIDAVYWAPFFLLKAWKDKQDKSYLVRCGNLSAWGLFLLSGAEWIDIF